MGTVRSVASDVTLMDGATGTELQRLGLDFAAGRSAEDWLWERPEAVSAVHRSYAQAGAEVVLTATFRLWDLPDFPRDRTATARRAVELAREATAGCWVFGSVGPTRTAGREIAAEIAAGFSSADGVILETFSDPSAFGLAAAIREKTGSPVFVSFTFDARKDFCTEAERLAERAEESGVVGLGVNCGRDLSVADCAEVVRRYRRITGLPLMARPNAGTPLRTKDGWVYPLTVKQFADEARGLIEAGATLIGGCCGTTPAHVRALAEVIRPGRR